MKGDLIVNRKDAFTTWGIRIVKGLGAAAAIYTGETSYMDFGL